MALSNMVDFVSIGNKGIHVVDSNPKVNGYAAELGDEAIYDDGSIGYKFIKTGASNTAWEQIATVESAGANGAGIANRLALYPASGNSIDDVLVQNSQNIDVAIASQPTRSTALEYLIPNPGDAVSSASFVLTEGNQTINGIKTFSSDVTVQGNLNVTGTVSTINSTDLTVKDKLITLNKGGVASSAGGAGIEFEENAVVTAYMKINAAETGYSFKAPLNANALDVITSSLTAARALTAPDASGTIMLGTGAAGQIGYFNSANSQTGSANFFWDNTNTRLGIGNGAPSATLHVTGAARITSLNAVQFVKSDASGNLTNAAVSLTADVSGILPIANGGTALSAVGTANQVLGVIGAGGTLEYKSILGTANQVNVAFAANSITLSLPQSIHAAATPTFANVTLSNQTAGSVLFAGASGVVSQDNANLFFDDTNNRLGIGTNAPSDSLHVAGSSKLAGQVTIVANTVSQVTTQSTVATTNATVTVLSTIAIPTNTMMMIEFRVTGVRTGGTAGNPLDSAAYIRNVKAKNIAGVVTIQNIQSTYTSEDVGSWNCIAAVSGTNVVCSVNGAANTNITWKATNIVNS